MPEVSSWSSITADYAATIAKYSQDNYTSKNVTVWLRYAHEVNFYAGPNGGQQVYKAGQDYYGFIQAWANIYNAIKDVEGLYLWWCPNADTSSEPVAPWWPGADQVDIASANNLPFAIGETGVSKSSSGSYPTEDNQQTWLHAILNPDDKSLANYPLYFSATWYETGKPIVDIDWYVVYNQPSSVVQQTISNTEVGS